jgi:CxxC motif-containing protein (DUF1111 family)
MSKRGNCGYVCLFSILIAFGANAQTDPGPRGGPPSAGAPLRGLTALQTSAFQQGLQHFNEVVSVSGTQPGATGSGLGPRFNLNSCAGCHAYPAVGGSSPAANPQPALATFYGAQNTVPPFITETGPVREVRFVSNADGTPDGGVHDLYVITGRTDAAGCSIAQPDFAAAVAANNAIFRIPTPTFGAGLIEAILDATILANQSANAGPKAQFGITGHPNRNPNTGTISRFGWKAQNTSLQIFGAEAYNNEIGVTNENFPQKRDDTKGCIFNPLPEDATNFSAATPIVGMSDVTGFSQFMGLLAPPAPVPNPNQSQQRGGQVFAQVGCALCHTPTLPTGPSSTAALNNKPVALFSDLLVHHMGTGLADGVMQGSAVGDEFRSTPLWGLGQRLFLLHDGRTTDLVQAITAHQSPGSESNQSVAAFLGLPAQAKQDLLNFLRSL